MLYRGVAGQQPNFSHTIWSLAADRFQQFVMQVEKQHQKGEDR